MRIDCHVHMVGNGLNGSGCYLNLTKYYYKLTAAFMLKSLGLRQDILKNGDLESDYCTLLERWLDSSSLDALVLLAQEQVYSEDGKPEPHLSNMHVPNDVVLSMYKKNPKFLPAVSIHPARPDALEELERCSSLGAKIMKCLPLYHKIDCNSARYKAFWQRMADLKMILLAHTGGEKALPVYRPDLATPACLKLPLECGVKVIAAHGAATYNTLICDYRPVMTEMLTRYPNLYVDNSGMHMLFRSLYFKVFFRDEFAGRVIHGSDLPVPISGFWAYVHGLISKADYLRSKAEINPLERDVLIKKALGFPEESFTLLSKLIN